MLRISDGWSEVGGEVRAALDQGGSRGTSLHGQAPEAVGRSPLVPRKDAWDLAPLAASSRAVLRRAEGCDANRTSDRRSLRAVLRKFYRSGEQI